ncbi:MAG: hypothetical protein EBU12_08005 [Microbacteriaceae bacterium]|nr:hypothetical protein [Microbacteriaceae bacterium]
MTNFKTPTLVALGLVLTLALSGCGGKKEPNANGIIVDESDSHVYCELSVQKSPQNIPSQTVAVLAPTTTFVDFETLITAAETEVKATLGGSLSGAQLKEAKGREFSVVMADGNPKMLSKLSVQPMGDAEYDITSAIDSTFGIFKLANNCAAGGFKRPQDQIKTTPESNLLKALSIAADQLTITSGPRKIFVLGNGIQTAGAIEMQTQGSFPKSPTTATLLAKRLKASGELPDLNGAEVYWYGLGQVDGENQALSESAATSLTSFWKQVIELAHGNLVEVYGQVGAGSPHPQAIPATSIEIPECKTRLYESDGVEFKPDSASFTNKKQAIAAAKQITANFKSKGCDEIAVTGYAAAGVDKSTYMKKKSKIDATNKTLTKNRAAAFGRLIRDAGFTGPIVSIGGGTCGSEWTPSGKVDVDLQKLCRRVEVAN